MPTTDREVQSAIQEHNDVGRIAAIPKNMQKFAADNPIYLYNVTPYEYRYQHPMVGILTINKCEDGEDHSKPTIIPGVIYQGVRLEMKGVEMRPEDGKAFVLDILQLGYGMRAQESPVHRGIFVASGDTFDYQKPHDWVESGTAFKKPTKKELADANARFFEWDQSLIAQGDKHWGEGPTGVDGTRGHANISDQMRDAAKRRNQARPWCLKIEQMANCPGCQESIKPGIVVHNCGAVLDWDRAVELGIKKKEDHPKYKAAV